MPRYVLLRHELPPDSGRASHWDFMLEHEGVLWTWALEQLPASWQKNLGILCEGGDEKVAARRLGDHRAAYLVYEGPVSGKLGSVQRVAEGSFDWLDTRASQVEVNLDGKLSGRVRFSRPDSDSTEWLHAQ